MNNIETLESLKSEYFDQSRAFLLALQNNRPSEELDVIRRRIREILEKIDELELGEAGA